MTEEKNGAAHWNWEDTKLEPEKFRDNNITSDLASQAVRYIMDYNKAQTKYRIEIDISDTVTVYVFNAGTCEVPNLFCISNGWEMKSFISLMDEALVDAES